MSETKRISCPQCRKLHEIRVREKREEIRCAGCKTKIIIENGAILRWEAPKDKVQCPGCGKTWYPLKLSKKQWRQDFECKICKTKWTLTDHNVVERELKKRYYDGQDIEEE